MWPCVGCVHNIMVEPPSTFSIKITASILFNSCKVFHYTAMNLGFFLLSAESLEGLPLCDHLGWAFLRVQEWEWADIIKWAPFELGPATADLLL